MSTRFPITLTQLSYFAECAKTLNMTEASQNLHVAQSAISTAISQLEKALATPLFIRIHSKGLILTPEGERLLRNSRSLFALMNETIEMFQEGEGSPHGPLTIACFSTLAPFLLPHVITYLKHHHPGLELEIIEGNHEETMAALRSGRAELAINYALTDSADIRHTVLEEVGAHIIIPTDHPLAHRSSASLSELADDPFILLDLPSSSAYFLSILRQAGVNPKIRYRTRGYETVRSMVASGLGYSILNQQPRIKATYAGRQTVTLAIEDHAPGLKVAVSSLAQLPETIKGQALTEAVRHVLSEEKRPGQSLSEKSSEV